MLCCLSTVYCILLWSWWPFFFFVCLGYYLASDHHRNSRKCPQCFNKLHPSSSWSWCGVRSCLDFVYSIFRDCFFRVFFIIWMITWCVHRGSAAANAISQYSLAVILYLFIRCMGLHKATWGGEFLLFISAEICLLFLYLEKKVLQNTSFIFSTFNAHSTRLVSSHSHGCH